MPDLSAAHFVTRDPGAYDLTHLGTAAGTTTILSTPGFLSHITFNTRAASGTVIVYDSAGTSGTVIGTISLGSQTFSDPIPFVYKGRTNNGLTVSYTAALDLTVSSSPG